MSMNVIISVLDLTLLEMDDSLFSSGGIFLELDVIISVFNMLILGIDVFIYS